MKTPPQRRKVQNDIHQARGRFRNVLNDTLAGSDDDGNASEEDLPHRGRPPKHLANIMQREIQSPRSSRHNSLSPGKYITPTKRRKREERESESLGIENDKSSSVQPTQKIQAESFVMKLFDRSLDLSKYTEQTALYPICRAWMANQPRNPNIRSYRDRRSPSPVERKSNAAEILEQLQRGEIRNVKSMPAPKRTDLPKIPVLSRDVSSTKEIDDVVFGSKNLSKDELLDNHLMKWKTLKSSWLKQNSNYQKRYEINHLILQQLFKP
ncbi:PREDICTED: protein lin-37 homolog [Bactrocera latifrons]|uniref:Protein lin-37 n=1 Tax=Bactrocera latifrons TaxID=174628 RepID=A0A0K8UWY3_BACLA|nr:PREDICTED: protein lin-37 homolog [Bactrocera latifrons]